MEMSFQEPPPPYSETAPPSAPPAYLSAPEPIKSAPGSGMVPMPRYDAMASLRQGPLGRLEAMDQVVVMPDYNVDARGRRTVKGFQIMTANKEPLFSAGDAEHFFIKDLRGNDIVALRKFLNDSQQVMTIESPPGLPMGKITRDRTRPNSELSVYDERGVKIYDISSAILARIRDNAGDFKITNVLSPRLFGIIREVWDGSIGKQDARVMFYLLEFPDETCVQHKALITSAVLLLGALATSRTGPIWTPTTTQVRIPVRTLPTTQVASTVRTAPTTRVRTTRRATPEEARAEEECIGSSCQLFCLCLEICADASQSSSSGSSTRGTTTTTFSGSSGGRTTTTFS